MPYKDPEIAREKTRERMRRLRAIPGYSVTKNKAWEAKNPEKKKAHKDVENAIRWKRLVKGPCEVCGAEKVEAHHDDYSRTLDVRWLCRPHHLEHHRRAAESV